MNVGQLETEAPLTKTRISAASRSLPVRFLTLLVGLLLLAGCGGGANPVGGTGASTSTSGVTAAQDAGAAQPALATSANPTFAAANDFVPVAPENVLTSTSTNGQAKVLITYRTQPDVTDHANVQSKGGAVKASFSFVNVMAATVPVSSIDALSKDPRVLRVEPDLPIQALTELDNTWGVADIGAGTVQAGGNKGTGIKIAVLDSGIDYTHPELAAAYAGGYNFVNNTADPKDDNGHGTHCSGTIAAAANGTGVVGVAPEARIYALKVLDSTGSGNFSNIIAALQWCVTNKIQVTSNSYGSTGNPGTAVENAFIAAQNAGIINVAAAGNNGTTAGTENNVNYPGQYASCIAVAAVDSSHVRASFSSTGPKVDICAPGVNVNSTTMGGGYAAWSGTSMATPHVAGAVALALKAGVAPADIRTRLAATALDLGTAGKDTWYGAGLVRAPAFCTVVNTPPTVSITSPTANQSFLSGTTITFSGGAVDTQDGNLSASMRWTVNGTTYTGASFTATLPIGTYTATASATDNGGLTTTASVTFSVANSAPVVTITAPTSGSSFATGAAITFTGTATDREDGTLTSGLVWTIGTTVIGRGGSFSTSTLAAGTYTVTATATDSKGLASSASVSITVGTKTLTVKVVTDKATYANNTYVTITTTVTSAGVAVPSATVQVLLTTANGKKYTASGTTATNGTLAFRYLTASTTDGVGTYQLSSAASKTGYTTTSGTTTFSVTK